MENTVVVKYLPNCEIPGHMNAEDSRYEALIDNTEWTYLCPKHFASFGAELGQGRGRLLLLDDEDPDQVLGEISDMTTTADKPKTKTRGRKTKNDQENPAPENQENDPAPVPEPEPDPAPKSKKGDKSKGEDEGKRVTLLIEMVVDTKTPDGFVEAIPFKISKPNFGRSTRTISSLA